MHITSSSVSQLKRLWLKPEHERKFIYSHINIHTSKSVHVYSTYLLIWVFLSFSRVGRLSPLPELQLWSGCNYHVSFLDFYIILIYVYNNSHLWMCIKTWKDIICIHIYLDRRVSAVKWLSLPHFLRNFCIIKMIIKYKIRIHGYKHMQ
jgi:hypothetical protein